MTMAENLRFIQGLRSMGWTEKQINDLICYIASGDERYIPVRRMN